MCECIYHILQKTHFTARIEKVFLKYSYWRIVYHELTSDMVRDEVFFMKQTFAASGQPLLIELQNYEKQGISIWLEGFPSNSDEVSETMFVRENVDYMRDYVFNEGALSELRFDVVKTKE